MFKTNHSSSLLHSFRSFRKNEEGNLALTFAISLTVLVGVLGAAVDFSALSSAKSKSQSIADSTALAAAIYIKDHNRPPKTDEEGYRDGITYNASQLGYDFKSSVEGGAEKVNIRVDYDDNAKEATVTVSGQTKPYFAQIFGNDTLPFTSQSVVSYLDAESAFPASISLVLDNSGSMAWDDKLALESGRSPFGAAPRIDGLKNSVNTFTRELESRLNIGEDDQKTIRMGMLPYSSDIVSNNRVEMQFGFLSPSQVNNMRPSGSTNSNPPMRAALEEMRDENEAHRREAVRAGKAYEEPLKFVIFMSDGQNTSGQFDFVPSRRSRFYYKFDTSRNLWLRSYRNRSGFERGFLILASDRLTIEACDQLKAQGTEIFTIGYALEVGEYNRNRSSDPTSTASVSVANQSTAFSLLNSCASSVENFVRADNNEELEAAFDTIQNAIVEELIRIKS